MKNQIWRKNVDSSFLLACFFSIKTICLNNLKFLNCITLLSFHTKVKYVKYLIQQFFVKMFWRFLFVSFEQKKFSLHSEEFFFCWNDKEIETQILLCFFQKVNRNVFRIEMLNKHQEFTVHSAQENQTSKNVITNRFENKFSTDLHLSRFKKHFTFFFDGKIDLWSLS